MTKLKSIKGFSLFELLVTISIIGILVSVATVSFSSAQKKARDARSVQDIGMIQKSAELYYSLNSFTYPLTTKFSAGEKWTAPDGTTVILESFPKPPKSTQYYASSDGTTYCVCADVEDSNNGNATAANCTMSQTGGAYYCAKNQQ